MLSEAEAELFFLPSTLKYSISDSFLAEFNKKPDAKESGKTVAETQGQEFEAEERKKQAYNW